MSPTEAYCPRCQSSWVPQNRPELVDLCSAFKRFCHDFYTEPNNESPLNAAAAKLWEDQEGRFHPRMAFVTFRSFSFTHVTFISTTCRSCIIILVIILTPDINVV